MSIRKLLSLEDESPYENWTDYEQPELGCKDFPSYTDPQAKSSIFFRTHAWKRLRTEVIEHYGRRCMKCGITKETIQVDHIKPRYIYPELSLDFNNLQVLCLPCNKTKGIKTRDYRPKK